MKSLSILDYSDSQIGIKRPKFITIPNKSLIASRSGGSSVSNEFDLLPLL